MSIEHILSPGAATLLYPMEKVLRRKFQDRRIELYQSITLLDEIDQHNNGNLQ